MVKKESIIITLYIYLQRRTFNMDLGTYIMLGITIMLLVALIIVRIQMK